MANVQHNSLTGADLHEAGPVTVDLDLTDQASDPATPASGHHAAYTKAGGLYVKDDAGAVVGPLIDAASSVSLGTPALTLGTTNAAGSGSTAVGTGATIAAFDATVPVTQALGDAAAAGTAAVAARRDHKHGMPALSTATPLVESGSGAAGTGTLSSREDHVHPAGGGGMTNPMTTQDDIIVGGASGTPGRLGKGSDGQVLTVDPTTHHLIWATPGSGSSPLTTKGDLYGFDTADARIPIGSDGWVLTADSTQGLGLKWAASASGFADPTTTKGDLIVHGASTMRLGVGADGTVLTADSAQAEGVRWAAGGGGGFTPAGFTGGYAKAVLQTADLISYWKLQEASGVWFSDSGPRGNSATRHGALTAYQQTGPIASPDAYAVQLSGSTFFVINAHSIFFWAIGLELWFNTTMTGTSQLFHLNAQGGGGNQLELIIGQTGGVHSGAGRIRFAFQGSGLDWGITSPSGSTYNDGNWHQVAVGWATADGATIATSDMTMYVDGSAVTPDSGAGQSGSPTSPPQPHPPAEANWYAAFGENLTGYLGHVALYGRPLTAAEVLAHWNARTT